jgi:hypothetical protein
VIRRLGWPARCRRGVRRLARRRPSAGPRGLQACTLGLHSQEQLCDSADHHRDRPDQEAMNTWLSLPLADEMGEHERAYAPTRRR